MLATGDPSGGIWPIWIVIDGRFASLKSETYCFYNGFGSFLKIPIDFPVIFSMVWDFHVSVFLVFIGTFENAN